MKAWRSSEAGYNMVLLIMAVTVLNIMIAAALPYWSSLVKREKEEELIFRGFQYAEGIRLFQRRFGRLPVQLQELIEVEPRCMRQLFDDPMTESGEWGLLFATAGSQRPDGQPGAPTPPPDGTTPADPEDLGGGGGTVGFGGDEDGRQVTVGPIQGVFSRSEEESLLVWNGETQYNRWHFTLNLITASAGVPNQPGGRSIPTLNVRWIGRPLPDFIPPGQIPGAGGTAGPGEGPNRRNLPNTIGGAQRRPPGQPTHPPPGGGRRN